MAPAAAPQGSSSPGVVLNAAFYSLARAVLQWLPRAGVWTMSVAIIMIVAGVLSAILSIFNAFQEEDWRRMLSLSSAENAGVAVAVLGVFLIVCRQWIAGAGGAGVDRLFTAFGGPQSWRRARFSSLPMAYIQSTTAISSGKRGYCATVRSCLVWARSLPR